MHYTKSFFKENKVLLATLGVAALLIIPLLDAGLWQNGTGHDLLFHLMRIASLTEGFKSGQFPVRINPGWYNGYGYASSVFYGDLFLWFPALLHLLGMPLQTAYKFFVILCNIVTFAVSYISFKGIFDDGNVAAIGSVWYTMSLYRVINVYIRHAVGEHTASIFFPLVAYALFCLLKKENEAKKGWKLLAIAMTGILQSHIISFEISVGVITVICLIYIKRVLRKDAILGFLEAMAVTALANLWFLVPFIDYMITGTFNANTGSEYKMSVDIGENGLFIKQMFKALYGAAGVNLPSSKGFATEMPLGVGLSGLFILALGVYAIIRQSKYNDGKPQRFPMVLVMGSLASLWLASLYFPWNALGDLSKVIKYATVNIQFPWRFLGAGTAFLTVLFCYELKAIKKQLTFKIALIIAVVIVAVNGLTITYLLHDETKVSKKITVERIEDLNTCEPSGEEYLPYGTNVKALLKDDIRTTNVTIGDWSKSYLHMEIECTNDSGEQGYILLPLLYYKGYEAVCVNDKSRHYLNVTYGDNKRVLVGIPSGITGTLKVNFKKPNVWKIADMVSLITMLYIAITKYIFRFKERTLDR